MYAYRKQIRATRYESSCVRQIGPERRKANALACKPVQKHCMFDGAVALQIFSSLTPIKP